MIDRYTITAGANRVKERFGVEVPDRYRPRYNAGPAQLLPVITAGSAGLSYFYWGTPPEWAANRSISEKIVNVRAEQLPEKPVFRKKLARFRCIIPCDGFYLWKRIGRKRSVPYRIIEKNKGLFSMAGLWEEFDDTEGQAHHTFTLITTEANAAVAPIYERMPALLDKEAELVWLDSGTAEAQLMAVIRRNNALVLEPYSVTPRIGSPEIDVPSLILPAAPADQFGNLTLFD